MSRQVDRSRSHLTWKSAIHPLLLLTLFVILPMSAASAHQAASLLAHSEGERGKLAPAANDNEYRTLRDAAGFVHPISEMSTPKIVLLDPTPRLMTDKKELVIRGVVSGPKAMKVLVGNTIAEANGTVFVARIELHEGLNRIPMVAETSAGKRAKKTLKISYKPPSKANATSTQSIFQTSDEPGIPQLTRYEWARQPVARGGVVGLDADGNIYTAAGNAGSTSSDGYLQKYDPEGNELWTREVVSAGQRFDGPLGAER